MIEFRRTDAYIRWFDTLRDQQTKGRILIRLRRLERGNPGDVGSVGEGVSELRFDFGPGYRVYYLQLGDVDHLLNGGDKSTQERDIRIAKDLAREIRRQDGEG